MVSPDRVFARVVLSALALVGFLLVLALELIVLSAGSANSATTAFRCWVAPVSSMDTALHGAAVALGILAVVPVVQGVRAASRARTSVVELHDAARAARLASPPSAVSDAAAAAGLVGRIDVVEARRPFAFAYGWLRPRVCVSTGLVDRLDQHELEAVLHHEGWHVARRDPLRILMAQTVGAAFGVVPEIRRMVHHYVLAIEVAADRHVVATMGHPRSLASALAKTMAPPVSMPAFEGHAEARAAALAGAAPRLPRGRGRIAAVVLVAEVLLLVPLFTNGSIVTLIGLWIHPIC